MLYKFGQGTDGNLNAASNWTPTGGPPGPSDSALFSLVIGNSETLTGSAAVSFAQFRTHTGLGVGYQSTFDLNNVSFWTTKLLVYQATVDENGGSLTTSGLEVTDGVLLVGAGGTLVTHNVALKSTVQSQLARIFAVGGSWTNAGNVSFAPGSFGGSISADQGGTITIGGDILGGVGPSYYAGISADDALLAVSGSIDIAAVANISAEDGGVIHVAGDLLVNADQTDGSVAAGVAANGFDSVQGTIVPSTINIDHDLTLGYGAVLQTDNSGVVSVGGRLALPFGSHAYLFGGTIEAKGIVLGGTLQAEQAPGSFITGVDGGQTTIINSGTMDARFSLTVTGDIRGRGVVYVGDEASPQPSDVTVNGTIAGQDIRFGPSGSSLFAEHFASDGVQFFAAGDIIATPGIQSIAFDPTHDKLSLDKGGGHVEVLRMTGDFTGQQFVLTNNEFVTLQPVTS